MTPLEALQTALAAEHAALHVYGALGARTSLSATPGLYAELVAAHDAHRDLRDQLTERVREAGAEPVAAEPAYELPAPLATPADVTAAALDIERTCETTYVWVVEQTSGQERRFAVSALTSTAVRALAFRGSPEIFPGLRQ
jgi:hypothetical protein